jgi:valyl-tRNA synthetase
MLEYLHMNPNEHINSELLSPYNPNESEKEILALWEAADFANPDTCIADGITDSNATPFTIIMPPPNVTGTLHTGHSCMLAIQDAMIRYKRARGFKTLWLPGTDHAAIATQSKVEKEIAKKGESRYSLGREKFLEKVNAFARESQETIISQVKGLGASCDWSRLAYTMDETRSKAVFAVFKSMYDDGIIYRGSRIVNWDPKGETTISDDEIVYKEENAVMYTFQYGPFQIATARPETKFSDKYVVVHPSDERYMKFNHGDTFECEWINGNITATVIKDECIDKDFGTGAMTITPWHSGVDFELAQKYKLEVEQIIDFKGKLLPIAGEFAGLKINEAREKIVEKLDQKGLLIKKESYVHNIQTAERSGAIIEPQIMKQWFVDVNKEFPMKTEGVEGIEKGQLVTLKKLMLHPLEQKQIQFLPEYMDKTYFHWINNLKDWCISRQIWFGHRIPVWYRDNEVVCSIDSPGEGFMQDEDTLDTWFSSGLWTFSTMGWPQKTPDFETFRKTNVLETGKDIIFFWVARMILMTTYTLGELPFEKVYFHGMVLDEKGRKMSKSLGNALDPREVQQEFGTDALRMAYFIGTTVGTDMNLDLKKVKGFKNFANKLWNIARCLQTYQTQNISEKEVMITQEDEHLMQEWKQLGVAITKEIDKYYFHTATEKLYSFLWDRFAAELLEDLKKISLDETKSQQEKDSKVTTLNKIFLESLVVLHPFMPFVSEKIYRILKPNTQKLLAQTAWPNF